jgi:hypothetical protein
MLEPYKGYFAVEADMHDTALYVHIWLRNALQFQTSGDQQLEPNFSGCRGLTSCVGFPHISTTYNRLVLC